MFFFLLTFIFKKNRKSLSLKIDLTYSVLSKHTFFKLQNLQALRGFLKTFKMKCLILVHLPDCVLNQLRKLILQITITFAALPTAVQTRLNCMIIGDNDISGLLHVISLVHGYMRP